MVSSFAGRLYGLLDLHKGRANAYQIELGSLRKVAQFYTLHPSSQNCCLLLVGKPKQFRFSFGRKFRPVSVSAFRFSPFSVFGRNSLFRAENPYFC